MNINIDLAKDTLCKNILIYGYCKYENKGCAFSHHLNKPGSTPSGGLLANSTQSVNGAPTNIGGSTRPNVTATDTLVPLIVPHIAQGSVSLISAIPPTPQAQQSTSQANPPAPSTPASGTKKFNFNTPSFQPSFLQLFLPQSKFASTSNVKAIPTFVPETATSILPLPGQPKGVSGTYSSGPGSYPVIQGSHVVPSSSHADQTFKKFNTSTPSFTPASYTPEPQPSLYTGAHGAQSTQDYFQLRAYPLQYHLYAPAPPPRLTVPPPPFQTNALLMFIPNKLRERLTKKNEATLQTLPGLTLPEHVNVYHLLVPLDTQIVPKSRVYGVKTAVFKAFLNTDGNAYTLLCVENARITTEAPFHSAKVWRSLQNANVVKYYESFTLMAFGGKSPTLVIVYDYYPDSNTLSEQHVNRKLGGKLQPITEEVLILYVIQLSSALQAIHAKKLAARDALDLLKILVTNKNRIRIASLGLSDILRYSEAFELLLLSELQAQDIRNMTKVIVDLAMTVLQPNLRQGIGSLRTLLTFSESFLLILEALDAWEDKPISEFIETHLASHLLRFSDSLQTSNDYIELQLSSELENARLFRLITKLDFITANADGPEWQENGPKHVISLFKDYVFNEVNEIGKPVLNLLRVLTCMNKLDAGIEEKILLVNKDETQCMIVSYKEVKELIGTTFRGLMK